MATVDDLGAVLPGSTGARRRVVSLVPSLTEAIAVTLAGALVGATDWCTHPAGLAVTRVRGTKNPDVRAIIALAPDLVVSNREENRRKDVETLRAAGVPVWVTVTETVAQALSSMVRLFTEALAWPVPGWLVEAQQLWRVPAPANGLRVAVPIWRDPWMVVGGGTFTGDLLASLGYANVFDAADGRYPHVTVGQIRTAGPDLVILPDEPYRFTDQDGPEVFDGLPTVLVEGRLLTWYGPSLVGAAELIGARLAGAIAGITAITGITGAAGAPSPPG